MAEHDFFAHPNVNTPDAKYAGALLLHYLREIKNASAGATDRDLAEAGHV